jgi:site-specific DNA recombinase
MATAALYARVSSDHQKEEQTIASQTAALHAHARAAALEVPAGWVFEDEGYSGASLIRPGLERLRDLVAQHLVEVVVCYAPDRLARRYAYQVLLVEEFARAGTEVQFIKGPKGESAEDNLLLQFQGMIAEYEKAQIAERTRRGKLYRARAGSVSVLSRAPYGYRYLARGETAEARYEVVEEQAAVIQAIFHQYVEQMTPLSRLPSGLNAQGIPTPSGGAYWRASTLWNILRNPAYCGRAAYCKTTHVQQAPRWTSRNRGKLRAPRSVVRRPANEWIAIAVPPIVSTELFERAARRLADNRRFASRRAKTPALLQGLVSCLDCGYNRYRTSATGRRTSYYRCIGSDAFRHPNGQLCGSRPIRQEELEALVWQQTVGLLSDPELVRRELERRLVARQAQHPACAEKSRLESEQRRVDAAVERLITAYQEGWIEHGELQQRLPDLRRRQNSLRQQLHALSTQLVDHQTALQLAETLTSFMARLRTNADNCPMTDRQRIVRLLIKEVCVGNDTVLIRHSIPVPDRGGPTADCLLHSSHQDAWARGNL